MKKNNQIPIALYAVADLLTAALAWALFYFVRKWLLREDISSGGQLQVNYKFWLGVTFIPVGWVILYTIVGSYHSLYKKSRLFEFTSTFICSLIGSIVLFFLFILDDTRNNYSYYYLAFFSLLGIHFILTFLGRLIFLNLAKKQLINGSVHFNTLMIGSPEFAIRIFRETEKH